MTKLADLKQQLMDNPEVREEYARTDVEFSMIEAMIATRREAKRDVASHSGRVEQ